MPLANSKWRKEKQGGNAVVEFALVSVFLVPLLFGTFSIGMSLTKTVQASVVSRDAGAMFMRYVDFTNITNRNMLLRIANGMGMTNTGGNGVVVLTKVMYIGTNECALIGLTPANCPNYNRNVVVKRVTVGNNSVYTSPYGSPSAGILQSNGEITATNYLNQASARADNFASVMSLNPGEVAHISEAYFNTPEIDLPGYRGGTYVYQRNIF
ncbi:MAG: pilus assembly protein [Acidobacteria bacterium]|nr:pilus assembly protein [Acidobacteriota bacterium]